MLDAIYMESDQLNEAIVDMQFKFEIRPDQTTETIPNLVTDSAFFSVDIVETMSSTFAVRVTSYLLVTAAQSSEFLVDLTNTNVYFESLGEHLSEAVLDITLMKNIEGLYEQVTDGYLALGSREYLSSLGEQITEGPGYYISDGFSSDFSQNIGFEASLSYSILPMYPVVMGQISNMQLRLGRKDYFGAGPFEIVTGSSIDMWVAMAPGVFDQLNDLSADLFNGTALQPTITQYSSSNIDMIATVIVELQSEAVQESGSDITSNIYVYPEVVCPQGTDVYIALLLDSDVVVESGGFQLTSTDISMKKTRLGIVVKPDIIEYDACVLK